jgi:hypothetical protein
MKSLIYLREPEGILGSLGTAMSNSAVNAWIVLGLPLAA